MIIVQAKDREGKKWFWNANGSWQEKRDSNCHFSTAFGAITAFNKANASNRFMPREDRMEELEMVQLL